MDQAHPCNPEARCSVGCPGWGVFNSNPLDVQRCDECALYESDETAREHIARCDVCAKQYTRDVFALGEA